MTTSRGRVLSAAAVAAAAALLALFGPAIAGAAEPASIVVQDGVTQPVFNYADAIRERVWVRSSFDSDLDGLNDRIALDIMRPQASELA